MAILEFLIPVMREVGKLLLQRVGNAQSIEFKGRANLVTEMDRRSEAHLIQAIRARYPQHAILSEEAGLLPGEEGQPEWILDPLDGTKNFARGDERFGIMAAWAIEGRARAAWVYFPVGRSEVVHCRSRRRRVSKWSTVRHLDDSPYAIRSRDRITIVARNQAVCKRVRERLRVF